MDKLQSKALELILGTLDNQVLVTDLIKNKEFYYVHVNLPARWKIFGICYFQVERDVALPIAILSPIWVEYQSPRYGFEKSYILLFETKRRKKKATAERRECPEDAVPLIPVNFKLARVTFFLLHT